VIDKSVADPKRIHIRNKENSISNFSGSMEMENVTFVREPGHLDKSDFSGNIKAGLEITQ